MEHHVAFFKGRWSTRDPCQVPQYFGEGSAFGRVNFADEPVIVPSKKAMSCFTRLSNITSGLLLRDVKEGLGLRVWDRECRV